jgi:peptide/nickel transport system substrate-binding protein
MRVRAFAMALVGLLLITGFLRPAAGGPAPGGGIVFPIVGDPTFNPWHPRHFVESIFVTRVLFNGLTKWGKESRWVGDLAESWEVAADGLTWTFKLRRGVKWHDGRDFTADDVKFTYDVVLNPRLGATGRANFGSIKEVRVVDPNTVQFLLSAPQASIVAVVGVNAGILPRHAFAGVAPENYWTHDAFNKRMPIGTGAYKMKEYVSGSYVTLEKNPSYFGGTPSIDTITFRVLPDVNAQIAQFLAGDLNVLFIDNPALVRAVQGRANVEVNTLPQNNFYYMAPSHRNPLFQDRRVRQAMMHAFDRPAMIKGFLEGFATPASSPLTPVLKNFFNPNVKTYDFDRARARQLLAEAGWQPGSDGVLVKDGQRFRFTLLYPTVQYFEPLAALLQQYLRVIGIEAVLEGRDFNVFVQGMLARRYDALLGWWIMPEDPDFFNYAHSSAAERGFNLPMYANKDADALMESGRKATTVAERERIYKRLQEVMAEDLPYLQLWWPNEIRAWNRRLKGVPPIHLRAAFQWTHEWRLE